MRWVTALGSAAALTGFASAQTLDDDDNFTYCDELKRCFAAYTNDVNITYGIAIPPNPTAPFDTILQVTAPANIGWLGFAWGGTMTFDPLVVIWPNGSIPVISSRMATGYQSPPPYDDSKYTVLPGSYVNATNLVITALCTGCSSWAPDGNDPETLDPSQNYVAFAYSFTAVNDPTDADSAFQIHDSVGHFVSNFSSAQSSSFATWAAGTAGT